MGPVSTKNKIRQEIDFEKMDLKTYQITKLNGENYFLWRIKMEMILQKEKLWTVISDAPPTPMTTEWTNKDRSARASIGLLLEDKILIAISSCVTAQEIWIKLQSTYQHTNLISKLSLLKKLYGCRYNDFKNMEDYLNHIKELTERLRICGESIKDNHIIAVMLCGLPSTFDNIITAIESKPEKDLTIEFISEKLRDEANRKELKENEDGQDLAMKLSTENNNKTLRRKIVCYGCGGEGHIQRYCRVNKNDFNRPYFNREFNPNSGKQQSHVAQDNQEETEREELMLQDEWALSGSIIKNTDKESKWIVDSGATSHMTYLKRNLMDYKDLDNPMMIAMANGKRIEAKGKGNIFLTNFSQNNNSKGITLHNVLWAPELNFQLISVKKLCEVNLSVEFKKEECLIKNKGEILIKGNPYMNVFQINVKNGAQTDEKTMACVHTDEIKSS